MSIYPPIPLSPNDVFENKNLKKVYDEIRRINKALRELPSKSFQHDNIRVFLDDANLTIIERNTVCDAFRHNGWSLVESYTSVENGERVGLIKYVLTR